MNKEMGIDHPPSIDWQLSIKLANNNKDLAKDLLEMFVADLPKASDAIHSAFNQKQYQELTNQVHRLHGASCYCGVTRLKALLAKMELAVRERLFPHFESLLSEFYDEVNNILLAYKLTEFE
jgi:two-component system, NarL family, sensor histidine kinase BarA